MPLNEDQSRGRVQQSDTEKIQAQPPALTLRWDESRSPVPYSEADPQATPHPASSPRLTSPIGLTVPGSPSSAAEVLRTTLFCGPVGTATRNTS